MKDQSLLDKAKFLRTLGFADKDVAALLNTSENSIRVLISLSKKSKQKKSKSKTHTKEGQ
jgi:orotate phosphoribosyltransferase-like protein